MQRCSETLAARSGRCAYRAAEGKTRCSARRCKIRLFARPSSAGRWPVQNAAHTVNVRAVTCSPRHSDDYLPIQRLTRPARCVDTAAAVAVDNPETRTLFNLAKTEVEIAAAPEVVWSVLIDSARYPEWNPFMPRIDGVLEPGGRIQLHVALDPGRPPRRDPERVDSVVANAELVWTSLLLPFWVLRTQRIQRVIAMADGRTRYTTVETMSGPLSPLVWLFAHAKVQRGFEATAQALRQRAESL